MTTPAPSNRIGLPPVDPEAQAEANTIVDGICLWFRDNAELAERERQAEQARKDAA